MNARDFSATSSATSSATISTATSARQAIRSGRHRGPTSNLAPGHVQGNLAILPRAYASDFLLFCQRNPKPCPLVAVSDPGATSLAALGLDLDIRTDVPGYVLWQDGEHVSDLDTLTEVWRDDFVTFVIGCSFSFEAALLDAGIPLRHIAQGRNVAMWRTSIATVPAGRFSGPLVVSMRPMTPADAIRAIQITSRFPAVHGAPVHFGDPAAIGIADITRPDFGDAVEIMPGEVPVFWACGVTPQSAIRAARPALAITHKPGCMLITDLRNGDLSSS